MVEVEGRGNLSRSDVLECVLFGMIAFYVGNMCTEVFSFCYG